MTKLSRKLLLVTLALVLAISVIACVACKKITYYTLTYSAGEGTGTASIEEYAEGVDVALKGADTFTAPEGKEFAGWLVEGETTARAAGSRFTMPGKAVTLTAQWKTKTEPVKYTLTYAAGEGTGTAPATEQYSQGATVTVKGNMFAAPANKQFNGWSDGENTYQANATFAMPAKAVTLTAQWKTVEPAICTVTFDPNNESATWTVKVNEGEIVAKPAQDPVHTGGKTFRYWTDNGREFNFATPVTADLELTAAYAWKVTFSAGEGATGTVETVWVNTWSRIELPEATALSNGDKVFAGWSDGDAIYQAGDMYTGTGNVTFTAQWKDAPSADKYTLTFTAGNHGEGIPPAARQLAEGEKTTLPDGTGLTVQQGEGWDDEVFLGWSIKWNGPILAAGSEFTMPADDVTLQARWGKQPAPSTTYTVTYKSGEHGTGADITETLNAGDIKLKAADTFTAEQGYVFAGWQLVGGTEEDIYASDYTFKLANNVEFVALWTECYVTLDNDYQCYLFLFPDLYYGYLDIDGTIVEFYAEINGTNITVTLESGADFSGTFDGSTLNIEIKYGKQTFTFGTVQTQQHTVTFDPANGENTWTVKVNHGQTVAKPTAEPVIDDESGRVFRRWATDEGEFDFATPITSDITIEATYGHKVSFDAGAGAIGTVNPVWAVGGGITLPSGSGLSNAGKTFAGWSDGKYTYQAGTRFSVTASVTLTAVWESTEQPVDGYSLSFEGDNGTAPAPQVKQAGDVITLPANTWFSPEVQGYKFLGWYVKSDGFNSKLYQAGDTYTMPSNDVIFRAKFGQETFTVTYKAGDQATGADVVQTKTQNEVISLKSLSDLSNPFTINEDYVFAGWKLQGDESEKIYNAGEDFELTGNAVFIAQWTLQTIVGFEDITRTAAIYMTIGSGAVGSGEFYIYDQDDAIGFMYTLNGEAITFKMNDSKQFVGTFVDKKLVVTITYNEIDYVFDSNQPAPSGPSVTFDANGGSGDAPEVSLTETANGYKLTLPAADTFTAPEGKQFKEWNVTIDGKNFGAYKASGYVLCGADDRQVTVAAVWEVIPVIEEPAGIEFIGSCTTPSKQSLGGTTVGGQTFVKFVIDFDNNKITYYLSDGTNKTVTLPSPTTSSYMPKDLGEDASYYTEIKMAEVAYNLVISADRTQLLMCDNDDNALTNGLFKVNSGDTGDWVPFDLSEYCDSDTKLYFNEKVVLGSTTFLGIQFTKNSFNSGIKTIYVSNGAEKILTSLIPYSSANENNPYLMDFSSSSYNITIGKKADGKFYVVAFSYKTDADTTERELSGTAAPEF